MVRFASIARLLAVSAIFQACGTLGAIGKEPVDPRSLGIDIPPGEVRSGEGRRVTTSDQGQSTVGRIWVEVGDSRIVLLPDGRLVARSRAESTDTDRPFQPATKDDVAARWTAGKLAGFQTKTTRHYVFVYNTSEEFALVTSRVLESMVPGLLGFAELVKLKAQEPELPLVVLMFKTEAQFQEFQRMPRGIVAYYSPLDNHIVLYEENSLKDVKRELAIQLALSTIAHEGAHQILHNIGVQQRLSVWPMWLSEGLAEYLAPTSTGARLRWKGAGQVNDMRMFELEQYLKSRSSDGTDGQMVEHTVLAGRLTSTGYASAWALTHFLAKNQRAEFQKMLAAASELGPFETAQRVQPPGIVPGNLQQFRAVCGSDLVDLEKRLVAHLKKQPYTDPFAEWPHWVAMGLSGTGRSARRDANVFHTSEQAEKWRADFVARLPADQRDGAQTSVRTFPNRQAAELFARQWLQK